MSLEEIDEIDIVNLGKGRYVLISENRLNFLSGIEKGDLDNAVNEDIGVITKEEVNEKEGFCIGPSISFMPTLDCNLRCIYCYAKGGDNKIYMDLALARLAIDNLVKLRPGHHTEVLSIYFVGGGEPFLNFGYMKGVCEYAKKKFNNIEIIIVSNGAFNNEGFEWLIENNVAIRISYDGVYHNSQRPFISGRSSQKIVEKNIRKLAQTNIPLTVQLTITEQGVNAISDSVEQIADFGVEYIKIEPVHFSVLCRGEKRLVPDIGEYAENFINAIKSVIDKNLKVKIDNSIISRPTSGYYCGTGEGTNLIITPSGDITSCLEVCRKGEAHSDIMMYGNCSRNGFEISKLRRDFLDKLHFSNYFKCKNCNLKLICGGGCPMQSVWDNGDFFIPSGYNCQLHKIILPRLFEMVFENDRMLNVIFDNHEVKYNC